MPAAPLLQGASKAGGEGGKGGEGGVLFGGDGLGKPASGGSTKVYAGGASSGKLKVLLVLLLNCRV